MRSLPYVIALLAVACGDNLPAGDCTDTPDACRIACGYGSGDLPALTLGDQARLGSDIPIDTIVLVMQENRTFDHYFSSLTVPGQTVDGAAPDATNPDPLHAGQTLSRFHQPLACIDNPAESWDEVHREVDDGKLDGFTTQNATDVNDPSGLRTLGYYDETDLPYYYALARAFSISDRHFSAVQANSWTNRAFYMAGTSFGITTNTFPPTRDALDNPLPDLFTRLVDANVSWGFYVQDVPSLAILSGTFGRYAQFIYPYAQYFTDAAAGTLPSVVVVEGTDMMGGVSPDEDPPADFEVGQQMVSDITSALATSPQWPHAALFLTYDEQGGFYDHVAPPAACVPDDYAPQIGSDGVAAAFDHDGLRVPMIVVSPYAKRGHVSHVVTDHTSVLRFVAARFGLAALTHRDANAIPPFDMFDFDHPDTSFPILAPATIDPTRRDACAAKYPP